ncbi:hypothetical protein BJ508DRAFT_336983 [Ascobolus immersus RN42]|uniref:Uncharacterized protein n=1 Tax=Ascobolus immersus RN42 TaxID=1160509 RepID=A0A3N4H6T1_ASCIM|nr:hypothetical protein BJ508DRAFT_336983 [Ascobolus immersus RN42]
MALQEEKSDDQVKRFREALDAGKVSIAAASQEELGPKPPKRPKRTKYQEKQQSATAEDRLSPPVSTNNSESPQKSTQVPGSNTRPEDNQDSSSPEPEAEPLVPFQRQSTPPPPVRKRKRRAVPDESDNSDAPDSSLEKTSDVASNMKRRRIEVEDQEASPSRPEIHSDGSTRTTRTKSNSSKTTPRHTVANSLEDDNSHHDTALQSSAGN